MLYPANVSKGQSVSKLREFLRAKSTTFEGFKVPLCVTKSCKLCDFKNEKKWRRIIYVFLLHRSRCKLSPYRDNIWCIRLFPTSLQLNFFGVLAYAIWLLSRWHTVWHSGALNTCFLSFVTSASAICLCPALAQVILVYVTVIFLKLAHPILFCWVSICVFFNDNR